MYILLYSKNINFLLEVESGLPTYLPIKQPDPFKLDRKGDHSFSLSSLCRHHPQIKISQSFNYIIN